MIDSTLTSHRPRSRPARDQILLLTILLVLTAGAWAVTIYQAQTMDMSMGVALRGASAPEVPAADDAMDAMPGMQTGDATTDRMDGATSVSMAGMSGAAWAWDALGVFILAWSVMMAAMMLPSISPMLVLYHTMATRRRSTGTAFAPTWMFALGYLATWTAVGVMTWVVIRAASDLVSRMSATGRDTWAPLALGAVLITAGLYQFTPLKGVCLRQCQSPVGFVMTHWRDGRWGALRMGVVHGAYCLGCCWALFAVLVATGVMSLAWMLLLTLVVFAEKVLPLGPRAPQAIGVGFLVLGILVAVGATTMPGMV
jgi:predicted metal-binding membrane protein